MSRCRVPYDVAIWTGAVCGCGHAVEDHTRARNCTRCSCSNGYIATDLSNAITRSQSSPSPETITVNGVELIEVQP